MTVRLESKTLELALQSAAEQLGVNKDEIDYKMLEETSGFFGFGKKVIIEAWIKSRKRGRSAGNQPSNNYRRERDRDESFSDRRRNDREAERVAEKRDILPEELLAIQNELKQFCEKICEKMIGEKVCVNTQLEDDRLILDIDHEFFSQQISKNSKIAEALEHLLRKKPREIKQELPFRLFIDAQSMRQNRENELVDMAQDLSNKVSQNKRPIVLNYRSSYDRKIIHMALDKDDRVYTKSIGSGPNRKLMILPSRSDDEHANV